MGTIPSAHRSKGRKGHAARLTRLWVVALGILVASVATSSRAERARLLTGPLPLATVAHIEGTPPVIDGNLDDSCWKPCQELGPFSRQNGDGMARVQTRAWATYDDENLYLAIRCDEPEPSHLKAEMTKHDDPVWKDDSVEVFVLPGPEPRRHCRWVVNSRGVLYDDTVFENSFFPAWESGAEVKTRVLSDAWTVEMRIPFSAFPTPPKAGTKWGFNIGRTRFAGVEPEYSAWSCPLGLFSEPRRFGTMQFAEHLPVQLNLKSFPEGAWGNNLVAGALVATESGPRSWRIETSTASARSTVFKIPGRIATTGNAPKDFKYEIPVREGSEQYVVLQWGESASKEFLGRDVWPIAMNAQIPVHDLRVELAAFFRMHHATAGSPAVPSSCTHLANAARTALAKFDSEVDSAVLANRTVTPERASELVNPIRDFVRQIKSLRFVLWTQSPWKNVERNEMPTDIQDLQTLSIDGCQNETRSAVLMLTNLSGSDCEVRSRLSDLRLTFTKNKNMADQNEMESSDSSDKKGAPNATMVPSRSMPLRTALFRPLRGGRTVADPLIQLGELGRLAIPAGETRQVWITIPTHSLEPGDYRGKIVIRPLLSAEPKKTVAVDLKVHPLRLPSKMPIAVYLWDYARSDAYMHDLLDHHVNRFLIGTTSCLPKVNKDGSIRKIDYTRHDRDVRLKFCPGSEIVYSYGVVRDFNEKVAKPNGWAFLGPEWKKAFGAWFPDWIAHIRSLGLNYNDFCMQIWDEAAGPDVDRVVEAGPFLRSLDPHVRWVMDGWQSPAEVKRMAPFVDIWIPELNLIGRLPEHEKVLGAYRATGKPVWSYTCFADMAGQPVIGYYRLKPWLVWKLGLDGVCFWSYNSWRGDSLDEFDNAGRVGYTDNAVVYQGDRGPIPSRRWEAFREGLEDYLHLTMCQTAIDAARKGGRDKEADEAQQRLTSIVDAAIADNPTGGQTDRWRQEIVNMTIRLDAESEK